MNKFFTSVFEVLDKGRVFRRAAFIWILFLTNEAFVWAMEFSMYGDASVDKAALIAAILTPLAGIQAWVLKIYTDNALNDRKQKHIENGV